LYIGQQIKVQVVDVKDDGKYSLDMRFLSQPVGKEGSEVRAPEDEPSLADKDFGNPMDRWKFHLLHDEEFDSNDVSLDPSKLVSSVCDKGDDADDTSSNPLDRGDTEYSLMDTDGFFAHMPGNETDYYSDGPLDGKEQAQQAHLAQGTDVLPERSDQYQDLLDDDWSAWNEPSKIELGATLDAYDPSCCAAHQALEDSSALVSFVRDGGNDTKDNSADPADREATDYDPMETEGFIGSVADDGADYDDGLLEGKDADANSNFGFVSPSDHEELDGTVIHDELVDDDLSETRGLRDRRRFRRRDYSLSRPRDRFLSRPRDRSFSRPRGRTRRDQEDHDDISDCTDPARHFAQRRRDTSLDRRSPRKDRNHHHDRRRRSRSPRRPCGPGGEQVVGEQRRSFGLFYQEALDGGPCRHWTEKGRCLRGSSCPFWHSTAILTPRETRSHRLDDCTPERERHRR
jgi:hypothetical protein